MKKITLLILSFFVFVINGFSQKIIWQNHVGDTNSMEMSYSIIRSADQGFYICGLDGAIGFGQENILLAKINSTGDTIWKKSIGYEGTGEFARSIIETEDGLMILGYTESMGAGAADMYLVKTNISGDVIWEKTYGGVANDDGIKVVKFKNNFLIVGHSYNISTFEYDIFLVAINPQGDTLWTKKFGTEYDDFLINLIESPSNGFVGVGYTYGNNADFIDVYAFHIDSLGNILWSNSYDGFEQGQSSGDYGTSIVEHSNGTYSILATENYIYQTSFTGNLWLLNLDSNGDTIKTKSIIIDKPINTTELLEIEGHQYAIVNAINEVDEEQGMILKFDANLDTVYSFRIKSDSYTHLNSAIADSNYIFLTGYQTNLYKTYEAYISKVDVSQSTTGIRANTSAKIKLYPNPSTEYILVESSECARYIIVGIDGIIIRKLSYISNKIDIKNLSSGKYIIQLFDEQNKLCGSEKFIKP